MGIFSRKSKFEVKQEVIRVREVVEPRAKKDLQQQQQQHRQSASASASGSGGPPPRRLHAGATIAKANTNGSAVNGARRVASASPLPSASSGDETARRDRKRKIISSSRSPASPILTDDDDGDDDDWEARLDPRKRRKRAYQQRSVDLGRKLRHPKLWEGDEADTKELRIIHAVEVASLEQNCTPVLNLADTEVAVTLQYPGARYPERHQLVWANDKIDAVKDIMKVVNYVACNYLPDDETEPFLSQNPDHPGIYRRLEKSRNNSDGPGFKAALKEYNERLRGLQKKGVITKHLDSLHGIPQELVAFILTQVYDRTVAPKVELLQKYKNGSDNVYGELLHPFITNILVERAKMTSDQVFVDLGSGVGNVVLQAALEIGCESWGCEMMENPCNLADAQQREFASRCRLWGIAPGKVFLERGDFRKNDRIMEALKRADVILVNNQAFTSQLNDNLVSMFLDLKVGCKIISLKSFVHDHKNALNDVATSILDVEHHTYPEGYVSWTHASGTFCISTRK